MADYLGTSAADTILCGSEDDFASGLGGDDSILGDGGNDVIIGGSGLDTLNGGSGDDELVGGNGLDRIWGGQGNDTLNGGWGNDVMTGGPGDDVFSFGDTFSPHDRITDFVRGEDLIALLSMGITRIETAPDIDGSIYLTDFANGNVYILATGDLGQQVGMQIIDDGDLMVAADFTLADFILT
jgi:Ca2+-binding RTX toxin-like protein